MAYRGLLHPIACKGAMATGLAAGKYEVWEGRTALVSVVVPVMYLCVWRALPCGHCLPNCIVYHMISHTDKRCGVRLGVRAKCLSQHASPLAV